MTETEALLLYLDILKKQSEHEKCLSILNDSKATNVIKMESDIFLLKRESMIALEQWEELALLCRDRLSKEW